MRIGVMELVLIFIVALFAVGPDRLPGCAKKLGEAVAQFKKYSQEATREIKESVVEPLEEVQAPLREAVKPLEELDKTVKGSAKDLKDSFAGIGKEKKAAAPTEGKSAAAEAERQPEAAERREPRRQEVPGEVSSAAAVVLEENSSI